MKVHFLDGSNYYHNQRYKKRTRKLARFCLPANVIRLHRFLKKLSLYTASLHSFLFAPAANDIPKHWL